ncbi:GSCOCG00012848001-RA-CDS [Cotesia congregata]|nr:GSCOCG00012848001-RA-CDS [Cotesia congregata]
MNMECGKAPRYQCRICHGKFTHKHNLAAHMKLHIEEPKYACLNCDKKFYRRDKLAKHSATHQVYASQHN